MAISDRKRRLNVVIGRWLWIPGLLMAFPFFAFNVFVTFTSNYCCDTPWSNVDWMPPIIAFAGAMMICLVGIFLSRASVRIPRPSRHVLWFAAGIGWCGALSFGLGSAGSSYFFDSSTGGGELMFFMWTLGLLGVILALFLTIGGLVALWAGRGQMPAPRSFPAREER